MGVHNLIDSKKDCGELSTNGGKEGNTRSWATGKEYYCLCLAIQRSALSGLSHTLWLTTICLATCMYP